MPIETICQNCGVSFARPASAQARYCSKRCFDDARQVWAACERCGQRFRPKLHAGGGKRFCSARCREYGRPPKERTCEVCGSSFTPRHRARQVRYCSRACIAKSQQQPKIALACPECGKEWQDKPSMARRKFCSYACRAIAKVRSLPPTLIEAETYAALCELGISFEPQVRLGNHLVDVYIPMLNTVIECQGDYYHCNPTVYPGGPVTALQRRAVARDAARVSDLTAAGYRVVQLWESDIYRLGAVPLLRRELPLAH